ncbi:hypothetical protein METHPM2_920002 [Pseudomonas sp. PM2]
MNKSTFTDPIILSQNNNLEIFNL